MLSLKHGFYAVTLVATIIMSCEFKVTKRKSPQFAISADSLSDNITKLIKCEHINVDGKEVTANGHSSSELLVEIINGKKIPQNIDEQDLLNKEIARQIKRALKNQNDFNTFKVLFVDEETSGSVTKTHYSGHVWQSNEL